MMSQSLTKKRQPLEYSVLLKTMFTFERCLPRPLRGHIPQVIAAIAPRTMLERVENPALREIVKDTNVAFIHVPKTGGSSVSVYLYGHKVSHRPAEYYRLLDPVNFSSWLKFAVIRDPIDRFLSAFDYLQTPDRNFADRWFAWHLRRHRDINVFVERMDTSSRFRSMVTSFFHFRPQIDYVVADDQIIVNRLIPFESMAADVPALVARDDPLPHLNSTTGRRTPRTELSCLSFDIIAGIYAADCALHHLAQSARKDVFGLRLADNW